MRKTPIGIKTCLYCGKEVEIFHKERMNRNTFCSKKCQGKYTKEKNIREHPENIFECEICGEKVYRDPYSQKKNKHVTCSYECSNKLKSIIYRGEGNHQYGLKGHLNASWKSDEKISFYGYKMIRMLDHPFCNSDGFVFEHRLVAEEYLLNEENSVVIDGKRYLSPDFIVHHKDGNRLNNEVDNLQIMTLAEHTSYHAKKRKSDCRQ